MVTDMNKKLIVIVFLLWSSAYCVFGQANQWGPYDPGAARNTLSNVTPATGRAALGLGTMAVATSTDYVATSALALRLDTTNASISENLDVAGNAGAATLGITGHSTLTTASTTVITAGSSTATQTTRITNHGFTQLGEAATGIKMKVLTGTTSNTQGGVTNLAHGLTGAKIVGYTAHVYNATNDSVPPEYTESTGYQFHLSQSSTSIVIRNHTDSSVGILEKPITVLVWYVE
jgi:hypothetical protein